MHLGRIYTLKKNGFTLAEVLITLVIIGIVAALTVPTMMANSRRIEIETRLKQTYSILNNALTKSVAEYGPVYTWEEISDFYNTEKEVGFFNTYIAPHLNLNKELQDCSLSDLGYKTIKNVDGASASLTSIRTRAVLANGIIIFKTGGGELYDMEEFPGESNIYPTLSYYVDVNGSRPPNYFGKDIYTFSITTMGRNPRFETMGFVKAPVGGNAQVDKYWDIELEKVPKETLLTNCREDGRYCGALIQKNGWKIPKDYPHKI